jgi:RimJ/RimL family protein N-acetyltransferase
MLDFDFHITTPRLTLSYPNPANERHCEFVHELNNSPEMALVFKGRNMLFPDLAAARAHIEQTATSLEQKGYGRFLISRRPEHQESDDASVPFSESINTHDLIGFVSMQVGRHPGAPTIPDLGFAIMAKYYGKGYASEAAQGLMNYYHEAKGHTAFAGYTGPSNENSRKLFRRLGFEDRGLWDVTGVFGEGVWNTCQVFTLGHEGKLDGMREVEKSAVTQ